MNKYRIVRRNGCTGWVYVIQVKAWWWFWVVHYMHPFPCGSLENTRLQVKNLIRQDKEFSYRAKIGSSVVQ